MRTDVDLAPTIAPSAPPAPIRRRRPWLAITAVVAGAMLLLAAGVWRSVAVDALVRFPTDVDLHPRYEGTLTSFVDPATSAPLAAPRAVDLAVDRSIQAIARRARTTPCSSEKRSGSRWTVPSPRSRSTST